MTVTFKCFQSFNYMGVCIYTTRGNHDISTPPSSPNSLKHYHFSINYSTDLKHLLPKLDTLSHSCPLMAAINNIVVVGRSVSGHICYVYARANLVLVDSSGGGGAPLVQALQKQINPTTHRISEYTYLPLATVSNVPFQSSSRSVTTMLTGQLSLQVQFRPLPFHQFGA